MTTETNVTIYHHSDELESLPDIEPPDGAFIHGLYIQGARWMPVKAAIEAGQTKTVSGIKCAGGITDSVSKALLSQMPLLYVKAVPVDSNWDSTPVGHLRTGIYNCPCYSTSFRGQTYVFLATLDSKEPHLKWTKAGVALLLSSDDDT